MITRRVPIKGFQNAFYISSSSSKFPWRKVRTIYWRRRLFVVGLADGWSSQASIPGIDDPPTQSRRRAAPTTKLAGGRGYTARGRNGSKPDAQARDGTAFLACASGFDGCGENGSIKAARSIEDLASGAGSQLLPIPPATHCRPPVFFGNSARYAIGSAGSAKRPVWTLHRWCRSCGPATDRAARLARTSGFDGGHGSPTMSSWVI